MLRFEATPCPVILGADGVVRVRGSGVVLELVVGALDGGATPEQIAHHCPSLSLASIYSVISYVLTYRDGVDRYLRQRARGGPARITASKPLEESARANPARVG
jgi:uncharacterized protein (DUF433 family)